jgi:hypothetical protein
MHVLHIGPLTSLHTQSAALTYRALGYRATFVNTNPGVEPTCVPGVPDAADVLNPWARRRPRRQQSRAKNLLEDVKCVLRAGGRMRPDPDLSAALGAAARRHPPDVVVGTWGVQVLEATRAAQAALTGCAFVHNVLTYPEVPVAVRGAKGVLWRAHARMLAAAETKAYRQMLGDCDVRVHCSERMRAYLQAAVGLAGPGRDVVAVERFAGAYFPGTRLPKLSASDGQPHVVHVGATNFSGGTLDDLSRHFAELANAGIHVHYHSTASGGEIDSSLRAYCHPFPKMPLAPANPGLSEFMTQFDASVPIFNVRAPHDRFANALPTRFLFSLVAGVPIALPRGLYASCEEYVAARGIGIVYGSEAELASRLRDAPAMARLADRAAAESESVSADRHLAAYEALFTEAREIRGLRSRA